jgi:hypothetical protein
VPRVWIYFAECRKKRFERQCHILRNWRNIIPEINVFRLIFKQDFRNFRQMESAQQASHYLQGLSRCSVSFCHWTFRKRKLFFFVQWKAPCVTLTSCQA